MSGSRYFSTYSFSILLRSSFGMVVNRSQAKANVSGWINDLVEGDETAAQRIFDRYFEKVVRLARGNLRKSRRRVADEEDVALGAMGSFLRGAADGRFDCLKDREDLWRLLATITIRKAAAQVRSEKRLKRGGGEVRGESIFFGSAKEPGKSGFDHQRGSDPTPELAAMMSESCEQLLDRLGDETLQAVAVYKLQGFTHREIGHKIGRAEETVNRKVRRIREIWSEESSG